MELQVPRSMLSPLSDTACFPRSPRQTHCLPSALPLRDYLKICRPPPPPRVTLLPALPLPLVGGGQAREGGQGTARAAPTSERRAWSLDPPWPTQTQ